MDSGDERRRPVILQIVPRLDIGGAERGTVDIARAVVEAGGTALVVSEGGTLETELLRAKARHIVLPVASKSPFTIQRNIGRLVDLIRAEDVDLVHARSRAPAWSALSAARRTGRPFVTTFHAPYNAGGSLKRRYNSVMARGDRVIAISDFIARHVRETYGVGDDRLRRIHRGVDVVGLDPSAVSSERVASLAARWNLPDGVPVVMLPGRLARWKGQTVMIEAMAQLVRQDVVCLLVGVGAGHDGLRREIDQVIAARGLQGRVVPIDGCQDMAAAYRLADVVVSASTDPEGFGRVAVEAQAMGVPVVATNHGAALETVEPGVTGWLVPPGDPLALAQAVGAALDLDAEARVRLAAIARARVVEHFSRARMCAATLAVYRELLPQR
ncbi:MAG: glycosyltransferase family 4 protein [Proteobacteria bacterium]|nr:glycosyltransferase family 4 protein [Pseudomonadota bacterium]MDA1072992.1 glycosyltransferase family 4 protein [Pseudomonadota bacterium]